jgi:hypothetical protein
MNSLHPEILEIIKALAAGKGKVLVRVAEAARMLDCDAKTFEKQYVKTGLVTAVKPKHGRHVKYDVFELIRVPELMREREEFIKQQNDEEISEPKSINQLLIETESIWKPKRGAA